MFTSFFRRVLQGYGLARIVLGVSELVGLFSAYFLLETVLRYPSLSPSFVLTPDMIALVYLAVVLRGIFHIVSGVGLARAQAWVRLWLNAGWPIMVLITLGLAQTIFIDWRQTGVARQFTDVLSWGGVAGFLGWAGFDIFFAGPAAASAAKARRDTDELFSISQQHIFWTAIAAGLFFTVLLFFGKPIQQGFHRGFYKIHQADVKPVEKTDVVKVEAVSGIESTREKAGPAGRQDAKEETLLPPSPLPLPVDASQEERVLATGAEASSPGFTTEGRELPYRTLFGICAALCLITGFALQLRRVWLGHDVAALSWNGLAAMVLGFVFFFVYGLVMDLGVLIFTGFVCFLLCGLLLIMKIRLDNL